MNAPRKVAASTALLFLVSTAACSGAGAPARASSPCPVDSGRVLRPQGEGWHHGPIVEIDSTSGEARGVRGWSRQLLVQVKPPGGSTGRIWFTVTESTRLICRSGERLDPSAPLTPGMTVSAWTPFIMESDPGQAFADTLIVGSVP